MFVLNVTLLINKSLLLQVCGLEIPKYTHSSAQYRASCELFQGQSKSYSKLSDWKDMEVVYKCYKYSGSSEVLNEKYVEYFIIKFENACFSLQQKMPTSTKKKKSKTKLKPVSARKRSFVDNC